MITVEDGTNVALANSFVTVAEFETYLTDRGINLLVASSEPMLIKAMDYIRAQEDRFQGSRSYTNQRLPFPRVGMYIRSDEFPRYSIPEEVKTAQLQLALEVMKGVDLLPTVSGSFIKREKLGPLETEYSETVGIGSQPQLTAVEAILSILYGNTSGAFLTLRRV